MTLADINEGKFVGSASKRGPDGTLKALEVLIFRKGCCLRFNEGDYPWDLQAESMLTNATVATVAAALMRGR